MIENRLRSSIYLGGGGGGGGLVGIEQSGLLAPFVQQYWPLPPLSQQSALLAPKIARISIKLTQSLIIYQVFYRFRNSIVRNLRLHSNQGMQSLGLHSSTWALEGVVVACKEISIINNNSIYV